MKKYIFLLIAILNCQWAISADNCRMVSVGVNCFSKSVINQYYARKHNCDIQSPELKKYSGGGYPFDWCYILNFDSFIGALERGLTPFFQRIDLELFDHSFNGKKYVSPRDIKNGILWNHLFSNEEGFITELILSTEFEDKKAKMEYLITKFQALKDTKTIYVVSSNHITSNQLSRMYEALLTIRMGDKHFYILNLREKEAEQILSPTLSIKIKFVESISFGVVDPTVFSIFSEELAYLEADPFI